MRDSDTHAFDHERSDVPARWPVFIGAGVLVLLPLTIALISVLVSTVWAPPPRPDGAPRVEAAPPAAHAPRLQTDPEADLDALQKKWNRQLHTTGWVDRAAGIVHIPIEQAKQRLVANGLPDNTRAPTHSRAAGQPPATAGTDRAGDNAARGARNDGRRGQPVPYREQEMTP